MATGHELTYLINYAKQQGVTMSELSRRSNLVRQSKKRRLEKSNQNRKRFEELQEYGGDWWNK